MFSSTAYITTISFVHALAIENYVEKFHFGQRIQTDLNQKVYVFDIGIQGDVQHCITWCKARKQCKFINFDTKAIVCYHLGVDKEIDFSIDDNLEKKPGFVFGDKKDWNMTCYGICNDCNDVGVCAVNDIEETYLNCNNSECKSPRELSNIIMYRGNMFSTGNQIEYECKAGYKTKTNSTGPLTSTCMENGTWSYSGCFPDAVFTNNVHEFENSFYKLVLNKGDWSYAYEKCAELNLRLVDIKTHTELDFLGDTIRNKYNGTCYWTGGVRRDDGVLIWQDGTPLSDDRYFWRTNQPNNYKNQQDCVLMRDQNYKFNDKRCSFQCFPLCELL